MKMTKTDFTVKKTGYILEGETIVESLDSMGLSREGIRGTASFIFPTKKAVIEELGHTEKPKKVRLVITVKMEEI